MEIGDWRATRDLNWKALVRPVSVWRVLVAQDLLKPLERANGFEQGLFVRELDSQVAYGPQELATNPRSGRKGIELTEVLEIFCSSSISETSSTQ